VPIDTTDFELQTPDGPEHTVLARPSGIGTWPGVVFMMDGVGLRPSLIGMVERLAGLGYVVAMPDLFHRTPRLEPKALGELLRNPATRGQWRDTYFASANDTGHLRMDVEAVLEHLAGRSDVVQAPRGITGYCIGGNFALRGAGLFPEAFAAAASFHGGNLANDTPESPHLLASKLKAEVYVAGAVEDSSFPEAMKARLEQALSEAHVTHRVETYEGARHGFAVPDSPVFDAAAAERHWANLDALFSRRLKRAS
jgi:carboxymethylenebutenolidase